MVGWLLPPDALVNALILVRKTIEIVWVFATHTASYSFILLTPLLRDLKKHKIF